MLRESGDPAAAADVIRQAIELVPEWAEAHFALAEVLAEAGDAVGAVAAYRHYQTLAPEDSLGAALRLALLGATPIPKAAPRAYVARLFDEYAPRFDATLTERLAYRAPTALRDAVVHATAGKRFTRMIDLGCGTGLTGADFRPLAAWMEGVDLSPRMIAEAARRKIYDRLTVADLCVHLAVAEASFDLVVAADVFVYVGDLAPIFAAVRDKLTPGGLLAFTVQEAAAGDCTLGAELRYSHSRDYIRSCAKAAELEIVTLEAGVFRQEKGADVRGLLAVLRR
jgi:predicted TPR repeat methyltransferase